MSLLPLTDYQKIQPLLDADFWGTVRIRHFIYRFPREGRQFWVDDPEHPRAVFATWKDHPEACEEVYCADPARYPQILAQEPLASCRYFSAIPEQVREYLQAKYRFRYQNRCYAYALKDRARFTGQASPQVGTLRPEHSRIVADSWPYTSGEGEVEHFRTMIERFPSAAYYREEVPVAFCLLHDDGSMGALYVEPKYRGQGLGKLVAETFIVRLMEDDYPIYCNIIQTNKVSISLTEKMGLERFMERTWLGLGKSPRKKKSETIRDKEQS
jgi:GNAT superfamily N-acetyltransferase